MSFSNVFSVLVSFSSVPYPETTRIGSRSFCSSFVVLDRFVSSSCMLLEVGLRCMFMIFEVVFASMVFG